MVLVLVLGIGGCWSDESGSVATTESQDADRTDPTADDQGDGGAGAPMPIPGGGLSVPEALASEASGPLLVRGFLIAEGDRIRLCEMAAESYPPQCGGSFLVIEGLDLSTIDGLREEGDVRWAEDETSLLGERDGEVLIVTTTSI